MAALDPNAIVTVQVNTILAPTPSGFQQSGAIVSFGGTNQPANSTIVLTQFGDLARSVDPANNLTSATWNSGVLTMTAANPLPAGLVDGDDFDMAFSGFVPTTLNGVYTCTVVDITQNIFSVPMAVDPGLPTTYGVFAPYSSVQLNSMVATYFRQGIAMPVTVLELGVAADFADQIARLEQWLNNNTYSYYGYLMPEEWGTATNIPLGLPVFQQFVNPEAMTYFWLTLADPTCIGLIPDTVKSVIQLLEAPGVAAARQVSAPGNYSEFTLAGMFYQAVQFRATAITRVAPMCFKFIYGVTPYPLQNNGPLLLSMKQNAVNYIQTGAEGGINFTNIYQGVTADGQDYFNWWWTIDWVQLTINRVLSNAIINGANNPLAPLYYDQPGINFMEATLAGVMLSGVQFGMVNGPVVQTGYDPAYLAQQIQVGSFAGQCNVNAIPFLTYSQLNPGDYGRGEYDGLSTMFIPARGFVHILVVVTATNIVTM